MKNQLGTQTKFQLAKEIRELALPLDIRSLAIVACDWLLVFAMIGLVQFSAWFIPLAIIVVGSRQRGLSNLTHDASHGNLFLARRSNDLIGNIFSALPTLPPLFFFLPRHMKHHT